MGRSYVCRLRSFPKRIISSYHDKVTVKYDDKTRFEFVQQLDWKTMKQFSEKPRKENPKQLSYIPSNAAARSTPQMARRLTARTAWTAAGNGESRSHATRGPSRARGGERGRARNSPLPPWRWRRARATLATRLAICPDKRVGEGEGKVGAKGGGKGKGKASKGYERSNVANGAAEEGHDDIHTNLVRNGNAKLDDREFASNTQSRIDELLSYGVLDEWYVRKFYEDEYDPDAK